MDRIKFGYMNYDEIADRIAEGKLNIYDAVYTKDTHEQIFIKPDGTLMRTKSRIDIYNSLAEAETALNEKTDTYVGQIIGVAEDNRVVMYAVEYKNDLFVPYVVGSDVEFKTVEQWEELANTVSTRNRIYVYMNYRIVNSIWYPAIKIGNGATNIGNLKFLSYPVLPSDVQKWNAAEPNVQANWTEQDVHDDSYIQNKPMLGTAAAKNYTSSVVAGSTDLVEGGAVKSAIDNALTSAYKPGGTKTCAQLVSSLLIADNEGYVYNISDNGTTTADFVEGVGQPINAGQDVAVIKVGENTYKFNIMGGFIDLSGYALKSEMSVSTNGDKTTIQLKDGTSAEVLNQHQDISGKVDKVQGKGLSTNDYDDAAKNIVDGVTNALDGKVDKVNGKGLSTNDYTDADQEKLGGIETGAEVNVQSDWSQTDAEADDYIKNKPTLGTASALDVATSGNASSSQVVKGDDTRLNDSRTPTAHTHTLSDITDAGTAASKNSTSTVSSGSSDLVESGAVKIAIDNALISAYKPAGTKACAELVSSLLVAANEGYVYNISDSGTTTADFVEGAGHPINAGQDVAIVNVGSNTYKFNIMGGFIDLSNYVQKSSTTGLIKNDGSVDTTAYAKQSEMSVTTSGDKATIQLKSGTSAEVLTQHQDISGKVDKVDGKGLSTNDYTTTEKNKLAGIASNATKVESSTTNGNIKINNTETQVYDDSAIQEQLSTETTTVTGNPLNFTTLSAQNAKSTILSVEPIQDLHGFDKPWAGGAGKNKLPMTLSNIKSINTSGSWSGNVYTINGINITVQTDDGDNVIGISTSAGTPNGVIGFDVYADTSNFLPSGNYTLKGCPMGGSSSTFKLDIVDTTLGQTYAVDLGYGGSVQTITGSNIHCRIVLYAVSLSAMTFYPMVYLNSESDTSFAPYKNECPIFGRSEIGILGTNGKESTDPDYVVSNDLTISLGQTVYGGTLDVESGVMLIDRAKTKVDDLVWTYFSNYDCFSATISDMKISSTTDVCFVISDSYDKAGFSYDSALSSKPNGTMWVKNANFLRIKDSAYTDATLFKTARADVEIVYELATPTTLQLTPHAISILKGVNNFSTDGDSISLTYRVGEFATLGDLTSAVDSLDSKIDESKILTDTATGDKYILVVTNGVLSVEQVSN